MLINTMFSLEGLNKTEPVRFGMYKNFRVGVIRYFARGKNGAPDNILVECYESCHGASGQYFAKYNIYVEVDYRFCDGLNSASVGKWIMFGFYIKSNMDSITKTPVTKLRMRHYEEFSSNEVTRIETINPKIDDDEEVSEVQLPLVALQVMNEISNQTKYNEYGKR